MAVGKSATGHRTGYPFRGQGGTGARALLRSLRRSAGAYSARCQ